MLHFPEKIASYQTIKFVVVVLRDIYVDNKPQREATRQKLNREIDIFCF